MNSYRLVHVTIGYNNALTSQPARLEPMVQQLGKDWIRYTTNTWLIWTNKSPQTIAEMLHPLLSSEDLLFAGPLEPGSVPYGFLPGWVWAWLNTERDPVTGERVEETDWLKAFAMALPAPNTGAGNKAS